MLSAILAEDFVAQKLIQAGWMILAKNFRYIGCELDIVAKKKNTLIIVEVKYRRNSHGMQYAAAWDSLLPPNKRKALWRGANIFLCKTRVPCHTVRFDLAVVLDKKAKEPNDGANFSLNYFVDVLARG